MIHHLTPPSPEQVERIRNLANRRLSPEEFDAYVNAPMSEDERQGNRELVAWYQQRYSTVLARMQHARRAWARAKRRMPRHMPIGG